MSSNRLGVITGDNEMFAKLIVPTRSDGASIQMTSTEVGGDTFSMGGSTGTVEEEEYETYVSRLFIHDDHIEVGVLLDSGWGGKRIEATEGKEPDRTIRIGMREITDVRTEKVEKYPGLVFETDSELYKLKMAVPSESLLSNFTKEFDTGIIERAADKIEKKMGDAFASIEQTPQSADADSLTDELERLSDLYERGVLSEEEFQTAKSELLK